MKVLSLYLTHSYEPTFKVPESARNCKQLAINKKDMHTRQSIPSHITANPLLPTSLTHLLTPATR